MRLLALRADTIQAMRRLKLPCDDITPLGLWGSDMFLIGVSNEQFEVLRSWNVQTEDVTPASLRELSTDSPAIPKSPSAGPTASGARNPAMTASLTPSSTASIPPSAPAPGASAASHPARPSPSEGKSPSPLAERTVAMPAPLGSAAIPAAPAPATPAAAPAAPALPLASAAPALTLETPARPRPEERAPRPSMGRDAEGAAARASAATAAATVEEKNANAGKLRMTVDGEHMYAEIKGGKIVLKDRTYDSLAHARDSIRRERNKVAVWEYFDEGVKSWRVLNRD